MRVTVVLVFGLVLLASQLGLDVLLGGFVAGMITRVGAARATSCTVFESKLTAVGFGFFVPFFFITSGHRVRPRRARLGRSDRASWCMFFVLFLVVRGAPAMLLYRGVLSARDRAALAFYSATELPLVVAITTIAIDDRQDEALDRRRPGRRGDALDPDLPLRRRRSSETGRRRRRGRAARRPTP